MSRWLYKALILLMPTIFWSCNTNTSSLVKLEYPETKQEDSSSIYFSNRIADPFRWLENDTAQEVKEWVKAQNELTFRYLDGITNRNAIEKELTEMWNYEKQTEPFTAGKYVYYYKNSGLQNQSILYRKDIVTGIEQVFIDPNRFSTDGTTSLAGVDFDSSGNFVTIGLSEAGSDWRKVIIKNVHNGQQIDDTLTKIKFGGIAWRGKEGFYYSKYKEVEGSLLSVKTDQHLLMYHKIGTPQRDDKVIFGDEYKRRYVYGYTTEDGQYLVINAANSTTGDELYVQKLGTAASPITLVAPGFEYDYNVLDHQNDTLYISTNFNAPNQKLVKTSIRKPGPEHWIDVIGESAEAASFTTGSGYIFATLLKDACTVVYQYDYNGRLVRTISLPDKGTVSGLSGKRKDTILYYTFTNYITPGVIYTYNPETGISKLYYKSNIAFNPEEYISEQVFYHSKDGTKVPMIISYKKGTKLEGSTPTMLYGYGGFNISLKPAFNVATGLWLKKGGIYAVPNLRGGGEYGRQWHDAGTRMQKKHVFEDFEAAAEFLIENKYTRPDRLAISGRSNGGLLVGAVMTRRPDLMRVALPGVGVLDMLRYHKFTAGAGWAYDYGTADDDSLMFAYLKSYSPLHNVYCNKQYPAVLITTGDHDDRVVPAHSYKFAATLQKCRNNKQPMLIRIDVNTGHGAGKPVTKTIAELADILSFSFHCMSN